MQQTPEEKSQPEREQTDESLRTERDKTDRELTAGAEEKGRHERAEKLRALLRLLPIEREKTDLNLLTERARSDEAVANRDDFLTIVSHDLRNLVGTVSMSAQLIEQDGAHPSGGSTLVSAQRIRRAAARMTRLIEDLVDVSALEAGRLAMDASEGDATKLIAEAVETFRPPAAAKQISLDWVRAEAPVTATFDHDRILQVLANLIGNSIKFTPAGGTITVEVARLADMRMRVSVQDDGPGIPEGQLEAVFERFWQVGHDDRRGLGLGLYIAKGIVEAHGERIWAESRRGEGSAFHFTLPTSGARRSIP